MTELELPVMAESEYREESLRPLLDEFEARHRIHVRLRVLSYETAWQQIANLPCTAMGRMFPGSARPGSAIWWA